MVGFEHVFSQNGTLIAIPWGPASKSPLNSNRAQTTGILNMKTCQLQKLWEVSSADPSGACWAAGAVVVAATAASRLLQLFPILSSQKPSERHGKDVRADSKDLGVGWSDGQEMDRRLAQC